MSKRTDAWRAELQLWRTRIAPVAPRLSKLESDVGQAKYRLSLKEEVEAAMLALQERNHQRTVGVYESLLTEINREVIGGDKKVKLELRTLAGRPAMDIYMDNNGNPESVLNGSGGSVANVLSVGLRFIALSSIDRRKFIVLDEADCWLSADRVPYFANVVGKMGKELNFQSLVISHHPPSFFYEAASTIIQLTKESDEAGVKVNILKQDTMADDDQIATIRLINFMSHKDSLIPMGSGVTFLQAENDVGKSAIVTALNAITTGDFKREYIRHGNSESEVIMTFTDGQSISCKRVAKTNKDNKYSVIYRLFDAQGNMVHETPVKDEIPDWATKMMRIAPDQDMDIQISNQKLPVFLLNESPIRRASLLSIGKEINHITTMQNTYKDMVSADKKLVSDGEVEVGKLRALLKAAAPLDELETKLKILEEQEANIESINSQIEAMNDAISTLMRFPAGDLHVPDIPDFPIISDTLDIDRLIDKLNVSVPAIPATMPEFPDIKDLSEIDFMIATLKRSVPMPPKQLPALPELIDIDQIDVYIKKMRYAENLPSVPTLPAFPELIDESNFSDIQSLVLRFEQIKINGRQAVVKQQEIENLLSVSADKIAHLIDDLGGVCDACGQSIDKLIDNFIPASHHNS